MITIIDKLQNIDSHVRLVLSNGEIMFGKPDCIVHEEDDEGWETIPMLRFEPWEIGRALYFKAEDIESFDEVEEDEIPPFE